MIPVAALLALLCALDPVTWARVALGFECEVWQRDLLRNDAPRVAVNCFRQAGKSTAAALMALHLALHRPGSLILLVAPSLRQSAELFRKADGFAQRLDPKPRLVEDSATTLAFENGSRIVVTPGSEVTSRGFSDPALVIVDEASRVGDDCLEALTPMLSRGGALWLLSTPAGERGLFWRAFGELAADWARTTVRVDQVERPPAADYLAAARRQHGERWYRQEFLCSFEATDQALFDHAQLQACLDASVIPLFAPGGAASESAFAGGLLDSRVRPLGRA